jgi:hypothetical protein
MLNRTTNNCKLLTDVGTSKSYFNNTSCNGEISNNYLTRYSSKRFVFEKSNWLYAHGPLYRHINYVYVVGFPSPPPAMTNRMSKNCFTYTPNWTVWHLHLPNQQRDQSYWTETVSRNVVCFDVMFRCIVHTSQCRLLGHRKTFLTDVKYHRWLWVRTCNVHVHNWLHNHRKWA